MFGARNISVPRERTIVGGDASPAVCRFRRREALSSCVSRAMTRAGLSFVASDDGVAAVADGASAVVPSVHRRRTYPKAIHRPGARLSMLTRLLLVLRAGVQPRVHFSLLAFLTAVSPSSGSQNPCAHQPRPRRASDAPGRANPRKKTKPPSAWKTSRPKEPTCMRLRRAVIQGQMAGPFVRAFVLLPGFF
jgi:hypothetical protein